MIFYILDAFFIFFHIMAIIIYGSMFLFWAWRFVCLFRKKGSCKFRNCPFRSEYFFVLPCTKFPQTKAELESYKIELYKILEEIPKEEEEKKDG